MATAPFKTAIALALQEGTKASDLNANSPGNPTLPSATQNLESLSVENGIITATGTAAAGGYTLILTPDETGSHF